MQDMVEGGADFGALMTLPDLFVARTPEQARLLLSDTCQQLLARVIRAEASATEAAQAAQITVKDGRVEQENFDTYPVMTLAEMPKVESIVMPSGGFWGGVGEPTIAVAAPAVLNAIFAATGKRIRELPLSQHSLKRA